MDHALWPVGPIGKPTELHLMYPILAMNYTKYPQACKALIAYMLEAEQLQQVARSARAAISPTALNAYDSNPVWTADPKNTVFREAAKRTLTAGGLGSVGEKAATAIADFIVRRHVRQLLHRPRGRQGRDRDRRTAGEADLSLSTGRRGAGGGRAPSAGREEPIRWPICCSSSPGAPRDSARRHRVGPAQGQPRLARPLVHAAGGGVPGPVPRLSARARRLALVHRRTHRPHRRVHRHSRTTNGCGATPSSGSRCSTRCSTPASPASSNSPSASISRCCSTSSLPFKAIIRALVLIPFIVPTVLSAIAFWWIFDSQFSIISWSLRQIGLISEQYRLPRRSPGTRAGR